MSELLDNGQISQDIFDAVEKLKGGQFISLPDYTNGKGETANYLINGAVNYGEIKKMQNTALHSCTEEILAEISVEKGFTMEVLRNALSALTVASDKNMSENKEDRTAQAQAQADMYINFGKGLKMHIENETFKIDGLLKSKTNVRNQQPYKEPARVLTKAKRAIEKKLGFKSMKYCSFTIGKSEFITLSGMTVSTDME